MSNHEGIAREFIDSAKLTDEEVERGRHDAEFIRRPHIWPYPFLPLKRNAKDPDELYELAVLTYQDGEIVVLEGMSVAGPAKEAVTPKVHTDAESVIRDGWIVD